MPAKHFIALANKEMTAKESIGDLTPWQRMSSCKRSKLRQHCQQNDVKSLTLESHFLPCAYSITEYISIDCPRDYTCRRISSSSLTMPLIQKTWSSFLYLRPQKTSYSSPKTRTRPNISNIRCNPLTQNSCDRGIKRSCTDFHTSISLNFAGIAATLWLVPSQSLKMLDRSLISSRNQRSSKGDINADHSRKDGQSSTCWSISKTQSFWCGREMTLRTNRNEQWLRWDDSGTNEH